MNDAALDAVFGQHVQHDLQNEVSIAVLAAATVEGDNLHRPLLHSLIIRTFLTTTP